MFNQTPNLNKPLWQNGPNIGDFYNFPGSSNGQNQNSYSHDNGAQRSA